MQSLISNFFSKAFFIGYFLPAALFVVFHSILICFFEPKIYNYIKVKETLWSLDPECIIPLIIMTICFFSILFMALNRSFIRFLEGYHYFPCKKYFVKKKQSEFDEINNKINNCKRILKQNKQDERNWRIITKLSQKKSTSFPPKKEDILPTLFGNAIRSFEKYSEEVYGIDAIVMWPRILAVVPENFQRHINDAKSIVDFGVNCFYMLLSTIFACCYYTIETKNWKGGFLFIIVILSSKTLAYKLSVSSAIQWGYTVKAVFDLYRHDLLNKIGIYRNFNLEKQRKVWEKLNKIFLYHGDIKTIEEITRA